MNQDNGQLRNQMGRLGFGGTGVGNLYRAISDEQAAATIEAAWDAGIRYFDTAPHYGLGLSERRIGEFLAAKPRSEFVISTKVGRVLVPSPATADKKDPEGFDVPAVMRREWDPSEAGVRRSIEDSLERLGVDYIDIVYLHDPDVYSMEDAVKSALPALEKVRAEGLVRAIGVGTNTAGAAVECVEAADLDLLMLAGRFTMLEQPGSDGRPGAGLLDRCLELGTGVVSVGVYNSGILAKPELPSDAHYNYSQASEEILERARELAGICKEYDVELPTAAIQFPFRHPAVVNVTVGASKPEQISQSAERMSADIPAELWQELQQRRLIPA
ncbi:aldo/keto reductase [Pseudarthrobacter sp. NamB4]|uniref:aldo/keto reductase n=1 Tax=Pseudarthrobacter sp. NamB4 TaxID=2576837 RepID=UPI0010FE1B80|nr:aldo/keto reductase [Pseudarthrobacter sp. NamB4]TLM72215.1 aldo/keto reductase [Pseudarthrobacter sp. NamB4]